MKPPYLSPKLLGGTRKPGASWRDRGDKLRDLKRWDEAAQAYGRHLEQHPEDVAIWIQHGHMLKEAGHLTKAIASYNRSEELDPGDADRDIHLFHLRERLATIVESGEAPAAAEEDAEPPSPMARPRFSLPQHVPPGPGTLDATLIADRLRKQP